MIRLGRMYRHRFTGRCWRCFGYDGYWWLLKADNGTQRAVHWFRFWLLYREEKRRD